MLRLLVVRFGIYFFVRESFVVVFVAAMLFFIYFELFAFLGRVLFIIIYIYKYNVKSVRRVSEQRYTARHPNSAS